MPLTVFVTAARPAARLPERTFAYAVAIAGAAVLTLVTAAGLAKLSEASESRLEAPISGLLPQLWPVAAEAPAAKGDPSLPNAIDEPGAGPPYERA